MALTRRPVLLLDGGFATECERRGADLRDALWSARLLADDPDLVVAVHRAFREAGAEVISTASYQASVVGFGARGIAAGEAVRLMERSVTLARDAGPGLVAGSIGPWGAARADGSEYRGYRVPRAELQRFHAPRLNALIGAGADCLAIETMPVAGEVEVVLDLLDTASGPDAWVSFSCRDGGHLADGTPIESAVERIAVHPRVVAIGVNCIPPGLVTELLHRCRSATDKPLVAYPNSGEQWDARIRGWQPGAAPGVWQPREWVEAGARLVGGCCRTTSEDIAALGSMLKEEE